MPALRWPFVRGRVERGCGREIGLRKERAQVVTAGSGVKEEHRLDGRICE